MTRNRTPIIQDRLTTRPANEAECADLDAVFDGADARRCRCQWLKVTGWLWRDTTQEQRTAAQLEQTACGDPGSSSTSGLLAYLDGEPVGWVAVEPRTEYVKLRRLRMPWAGRGEDVDDESVWAITCFIVRKGYRRRGMTYLLVRAAVEHARARGACAVEGYPLTMPPGAAVTWGEAYVGLRQVFDEAGFREVSHPSKRRVVMRIDFSSASTGSGQSVPAQG